MVVNKNLIYFIVLGRTFRKQNNLQSNIGFIFIKNFNKHYAFGIYVFFNKSVGFTSNYCESSKKRASENFVLGHERFNVSAKLFRLKCTCQAFISQSNDNKQTQIHK